MHRTLRSGIRTSSPVHTMPRSRQRKAVRHFSGDGGENQAIDRLTCSVCGFKGVHILTQPGENFPTTFTTEGTRYVWDDPTEPVTSLDLFVTPVPNPNVSCGFCGATRYTDGSKGSGQ